MKAKTFENLIRKVVREEIDYALRREIKTLKEDLRDELKPTIVEHKERIVEVPNTPTGTTTSLKEKIMGVNSSTFRITNMGKFDNIKVSFYLASDTINEEDDDYNDENGSWEQNVFHIEP